MITRQQKDEAGAILVLALVFMVVTALIVTGLAAWSGNSIQNIGNLKTTRSALYAADGATQDAIWTARYTFTPIGTGFCSATPFANGGFSLDGRKIYVICAVVTADESSSSSRVINFSAYPINQCTAAGCSGNAYIQAQATFNDFSSLNANNCPTGGSPTTCGSGQTVNSWVVEPGLE